MKKILIAFSFVLFFSGCALMQEKKTCQNVPIVGCFNEVQEKDCGTDLDCFNKRLENCEKAKVKFTEEIELGEADGYKYFASKDSEAKIRSFSANICFVETTKVQGQPTTAGFRTRLWEKTDCKYYTNFPLSKEKTYEEPEFQSCYSSGG